MTLTEALRTYWTEEKFWQGSNFNADYTRFCISGLRFPYTNNPLPERFRLDLCLAIVSERDLITINDWEGREAVIDAIEQWEKRRNG